ncbi:hypothetical protein U9M48_015782 [Paspalum notatum var. saurae]|uniref:Uncharacterized protein n=1 Tax=Paspalum notatum var. saurae TaxID=547442 RepID=A0AAQ3T496_PASNO
MPLPAAPRRCRPRRTRSDADWPRGVSVTPRPARPPPPSRPRIPPPPAGPAPSRPGWMVGSAPAPSPFGGGYLGRGRARLDPTRRFRSPPSPVGHRSHLRLAPPRRRPEVAGTTQATATAAEANPYPSNSRGQPRGVVPALL